MSTNTFVVVSNPDPIGMTAQWGSNPVPTFQNASWNGPYSMPGVTKTASGTLESRRVFLMNYPGMAPLAMQDSAADGSFLFSHMKHAASGRYFLLAFDKSGATNAGVRDNVVPT